MVTFTDWLLVQAHRPDAVGWLAMNWLFDPDAPHPAAVAEAAQHMSDVPVAAKEALAQAVTEYRTQVPNNVIPFPR